MEAEFATVRKVQLTNFTDQLLVSDLVWSFSAYIYLYLCFSMPVTATFNAAAKNKWVILKPSIVRTYVRSYLQNAIAGTV